jgi:DNA invertase Pin-like site-specific DNA recombinase
METMTMKIPPTQSKQLKAAVYYRVNHIDKADGMEYVIPQPQKAALYCRVASRHPDDAGAIKIQLEKLRDFAKRQGHNVCMEYFDDGFSGNDLERPAFMEMEVAINEGKINTIIIRGVDRIARNMLLFAEWDEWRRSKGVQLITLDGYVF